MTEKTLFKKDVHRIPSLIYIKSEKTFLAFAEKRGGDTDVSAEYLVMRRGEYNERTKTVKWGVTESLEALCIEGDRMMNPCPVLEEKSAVLFLFFNSIPVGMTEEELKRQTVNKSKLCYVTSNDFGKTWNVVKIISRVLGKIKKMTVCFVSPGHGIQTASGALVIPAYAFVYNKEPKYCKPHSFYIYSVNDGKDWDTSKLIKSECGECEVAEIDGAGSQKILYCNGRTSTNKRLQAQADTVGGEFKIISKGNLSEVQYGCSGSVVSFPANDKSCLLFSHPCGKKREDLSIYVNQSPLQSDQWSKPWVIHKGPAGYSDLAICDDNSIGILYECGKNKPEEQITFSLLSNEDINKLNNQQQSICTIL